MAKKVPLCLTIILTLLLITACGGASAVLITDAEASGSEEHMDEEDHAAAEHDDGDSQGSSMNHMHVQAPHEFEELHNPLVTDHETLEAGEATFITLCATCHGPQGKGDGPGAAELDPKPADLSDGMMVGSLSDGYLFWRVSKGGAMEPFNSAMPAWEEGLTEEQRWQVIAYIRTLSAQHDDMAEDHGEEEEHQD